MHSSPDTVCMLANSRHRELQDEAVRRWRALQAEGDDPRARLAVAAAYRQLRATLGSIRQLLEFSRWTIALTIRGAFPR